MSESIELLLRSLKKAFFLDEVARRVAGERKLRKHDDFGVSRRGLPSRRDHAIHIASEVTYGGIDLPESDSHREVPF